MEESEAIRAAVYVLHDHKALSALLAHLVATTNKTSMTAQTLYGKMQEHNFVCREKQIIFISLVPQTGTLQGQTTHCILIFFMVCWASFRFLYLIFSLLMFLSNDFWKVASETVYFFSCEISRLLK